MIAIEQKQFLKRIINSQECLEIARKAIEDELVELRNERICQFTRRNGFVIREKDGTTSNIIRFGPEQGMRIGLKAIQKHLESNFI